MTATSSAHAGALRRYPALAWLAGAVALALLLPSGLNVPNAGPSSLAEYAPVPGAGDGSAPIAELGLSSSQGGPGTGGGFGAATTTTPPAGTGERLTVRKARSKRCVGTPPRQTEDPLSPPCVAHFEGNNFGATAKGVTRDEIVVVVYWTNSAEYAVVDYSEQAPPDERDVRDVAGRAFARYFNERYQLYGRRARLIGVHSSDSQSAEAWRADLVRIDRELAPFAVVSAGNSGMQVVTQEAARRGSIGVTHAGMPRAEYLRDRPRVQSFRPDLEDQIETSVSFMCAKLVGRPARFSGNVTDTGRERRFGLLYSNDPRDPMLAQLADGIEQAFRDSCGGTISSRAEANRNEDIPGAVARLRQDEVTTVIPSLLPGIRIASFTLVASTGWAPEWFLADVYGMDDAGNAQFYDSRAWRHAFGVISDYRRDRRQDQPFARAFKDACPDCTIPAGQDPPNLYDNLALLFYGIQAAGPRLTHANLDRGLQAIPANGSPDPYKPAAYFAPGNYSFVKDAMAVWWDPTTPPPGQSRPGCYRLVDGGARRRAGEWTAGDADLFTGSAPCQGSRYAAAGE